MASTSRAIQADEPPTETVQILLQHFVPYADQVGFFLHKQRFLAIATSADAQYRTSHLSRALLNSVYLYGARLSRDNALMAHEPAFLSRAVEAVSSDLGGSLPYPLTQTIQAEVILANYFFCGGRMLEGRYHCSAAVALALSAHLHKIRSLSTSDTSQPPDQPLDRIDEGERINAFWTVFMLDRAWSVATRLPSQLDGKDSGLSLDIPWPLDAEEYDRVGLAPEVRGSRTMYNFLHDLPSTSTDGTSILALRAKAAALLERATRYATSAPQVPGQQQGPSEQDIQLLARVIDRFAASLPEIHSLLDTGTICHLLVIHTQTHVATILLHRSAGEATGTIPERCLSAAKAAATLVGKADLQQVSYVDPILAPLWTIVVRVFIARIQPLGLLEGERDRLRSFLKKTLAAMARYSLISPLMAIEYSRL
ncbi:hypothetical protein DAEQUDRAFT_765192 [Daedalea quercina L-15889]|uniref:Xylanolytic transcriptional activator regulatory domain-containing protein n=1 Tax=Daedalea quercina L-15889 TaxID=1314783 RepID=A0A165QSR1_9APHY|nr:hypothetical protein DAEQUDRAFT_765192 [Daedalea quercina L-15889]